MKISLLALSVAFLFAFPVFPSKAADPKPKSASQIERMHKNNKRAAEKAWTQDERNFKRDEFRQMEADYQEINDKYREPTIKDIISRFLAKYEEGNRVGCARMYLAQKTSGPDREKLLLQLIEENSDAYYLDGCSVGGLARLYLASLYMQEGEKRKAEKWIAEIEEDFDEAQDHSGKPVVDQARELRKKA